MSDQADLKDWCLRNGKGIMADASHGHTSEREAAGIIIRLAEKDGFGYAAVKEALLSIRLNKPRQPTPYLRAILNRARDAQSAMEPVSPPKVAPRQDTPAQGSVRQVRTYRPSTAKRVTPERFDELKRFWQTAKGFGE